MATAITGSDYYFDAATLRTTVDAILLTHGIVDTQLAGHLCNIIYKQQITKCDLAAVASAA